MITIGKIITNGIDRPERQLTTEEQKTVIATHSNQTAYIYYQTGDEIPMITEVVNPDANDLLKLEADLEFGKKLINEFLLDNRISPQSFSPSDSLALLQKLQVIQALASLGDIKNVLPLMQAVDVDTIFTQDRKDKYVSMITDYLALWV